MTAYTTSKIDKKILIYFCIALVAVIFVTYALTHRIFKHAPSSQLHTQLENESENMQSKTTSKNIISSLSSEYEAIRRQVETMETSIQNLSNDLADIKQIITSSPENHLLQSETKNSFTNTTREIYENDDLANQDEELQLETTLFNIDSKLYEEETDITWSNDLDAQFQEVLNQPKMTGVSLIEQTCGSTLCRLELSFAASELAAEDIDDILTTTLDVGEGIININEQDANAVIYLSKTGYRLPFSTQTSD